MYCENTLEGRIKIPPIMMGNHFIIDCMHLKIMTIRLMRFSLQPGKMTENWIHRTGSW